MADNPEEELKAHHRTVEVVFLTVGLGGQDSAEKKETDPFVDATSSCETRVSKKCVLSFCIVLWIV